MDTLVEGSTCFVEYDAGGGVGFGELHERLIGPHVVNDEYVKMLKGRNTEAIYIEHDHARLHFTASCWEI